MELHIHNPVFCILEGMQIKVICFKKILFAGRNLAKQSSCKRNSRLMGEGGINEIKIHVPEVQNTCVIVITIHKATTFLVDSSQE